MRGETGRWVILPEFYDLTKRQFYYMLPPRSAPLRYSCFSEGRNLKETGLERKLDEIIQRIDRFERTILENAGAESEEILAEPAEADWRLRDEALAVEALRVGSVAELRESTRVVHEGFVHKWYCNFLNQCDTTYRGHCSLVNSNTGATLHCNLIESATRKDHSIDWWDTAPYSRVERNGYRIYYGFGKERHRSRHVSSCANFYGDWGSVSWKWTSFA